MKKTGLLAMTMMFLMFTVIPALYAGDSQKNAVKILNSQPQENYSPVKAKKTEGITVIGWSLIGLDVALAGLSLYALIDEKSAADSYNTLLKATNDTTQANYDILVKKKTEIDSKIQFAGITSGIMGAALLYTVVDIFWIHAAFPVTSKVTYNPVNKSVKLSLNGRF